MNVAGVIDIIGTLLYAALIGRVLLSWFQIGRCSPLYPIVNVLYQVTEPILAPIRRVLPTFGMMDFSPMVAIFLLIFIQRLLRNLIV